MLISQGSQIHEYYQLNNLMILVNEFHFYLYNFGKLSLENNDVLLRCNCNDFKWRFNFYDHIDKSLYGNKRKKYENLGGAPANPMKLPGMCKHIMKTAQALKDAGIFND